MRAAAGSSTQIAQRIARPVFIEIMRAKHESAGHPRLREGAQSSLGQVAIAVETREHIARHCDEIVVLPSATRQPLQPSDQVLAATIEMCVAEVQDAQARVVGWGGGWFEEGRWLEGEVRGRCFGRVEE